MDREGGATVSEVLFVFSLYRQAVPQRPEYAKTHLEREGVAYEVLDNGVLCCAKPRRLQAISNRLSASLIDALLRN